MIGSTMLLAEISQLWYSAPLIVVVSLVYAATRHEVMEPILAHALRFGAWITGFMTAILLVIFFLSSLS